MKKILICILLLLLYSCSEEKQSFAGTYGMVEYFSPVDNHTGYANVFVLDIKDSTATGYGTMPYWGVSFKYAVKGDTLILSNGDRLFREKPDGDIFNFETQYKDKLKVYKFRKYPGLDKLIDKAKNELNPDALTSYLNNSLIKGKYKLNGETVEFMDNREVKGLKEFSTYTILPRRGTIAWYDDCIMQTDNKDIWKYEFMNNELVLTKYTDKRDSWEHYILSDEQIRLRKI